MALCIFTMPNRSSDKTNGSCGIPNANMTLGLQSIDIDGQPKGSEEGARTYPLSRNTSIPAGTMLQKRLCGLSSRRALNLNSQCSTPVHLWVFGGQQSLQCGILDIYHSYFLSRIPHSLTATYAELLLI